MYGGSPILGTLLVQFLYLFLFLCWTRSVIPENRSPFSYIFLYFLLDWTAC